MTKADLPTEAMRQMLGKSPSLFTTTDPPGTKTSAGCDLPLRISKAPFVRVRAGDSPEPERDISLLATRIATVPRRFKKAPDVSPVEIMSLVKMASLGRMGRWFTRTVPLIPEMEPATSGRVNLPAPKPLAARIKIIPIRIPSHRRFLIFNLRPSDRISGCLITRRLFFQCQINFQCTVNVSVVLCTICVPAALYVPVTVRLYVPAGVATAFCDIGAMEPPPPQAAHVSTTTSISPNPIVARRRRVRTPVVAPVVARLSKPRSAGETPALQRTRRIAGRRPALQYARPASSASMDKNIKPIGLLPGGNTRQVFRGPANERAVVVTLTVTFCVPVPLSVTAAGVTAQVAPMGAPVQLNDTIPCNPFCGSTAMA